MEYIYYKDDKGNFGDDLNPWLWTQLLKDKEDVSFIGIGTVLYAENPILENLSSNVKTVFGTGYRPNLKYIPLRPDSSWDIKFLRGPLSVQALGNTSKFITDGAYAMRCLPGFSNYMNCDKKYEVSFMPYFRSVPYFNWPKICKQLGYNYISPYSEKGVEHTISEIALSKRIISEAMHGAIVADILRVPWHRFVLTTPHTEGSFISEFKWLDWLMSIGVSGINASQVSFYRGGRIRRLIRSITHDMLNFEVFVKSIVEQSIIENLGQNKNYCLSDDKTLDIIDDRISGEINLFNQ